MGLLHLPLASRSTPLPSVLPALLLLASPTSRLEPASGSLAAPGLPTPGRVSTVGKQLAAGDRHLSGSQTPAPSKWDAKIIHISCHGARVDFFSSREPPVLAGRLNTVPSQRCAEHRSPMAVCLISPECRFRPPHQ